MEMSASSIKSQVRRVTGIGSSPTRPTAAPRAKPLSTGETSERGPPPQRGGPRSAVQTKIQWTRSGRAGATWGPRGRRVAQRSGSAFPHPWGSWEGAPPLGDCPVFCRRSKDGARRRRPAADSANRGGRRDLGGPRPPASKVGPLTAGRSVGPGTDEAEQGKALEVLPRGFECLPAIQILAPQDLPHPFSSLPSLTGVGPRLHRGANFARAGTTGRVRGGGRGRLDEDLHRPPPLRGHRRPAHLQRHHHRDRHRLLPPRQHTSPSRGTRQGRLTAAYVPRWPAVLADAWPFRVAVPLEEVSRIEHGGDGLDLDELVLVTEHGDAHQRAGDVMVSERVPDYLPGGHQVLPPGRCDENPCANDVLE